MAKDRHELRAQNTKIIKAVQIFPEDRNVVLITGKNRQGKSTVLDAIWMALGGESCVPDIPIREGEEAGEIYLNFGEFTVTKKITKKGRYLTVQTKDGLQPSTPQRFLKSLLANLASNPLEFMRLKPEEQIKIIQGLFPIKIHKEEFEAIAGSWTRRIDGGNPMLFLDNVVKALAADRTELHREIVRLQGVVDSIEIPRGIQDIKPVLVADLFKQRSLLEEQQKKNDRVRQEVKAFHSRLEDLRNKLSYKNVEIAALEARLSSLREERESLVEDYANLQEQYLQKAEEEDALIDPDYSEINRQIAEADEHNKRANHIAQLKSNLQESKASLEKTQKDYQDLTNRIEAVKQYKNRLIEKAKLPLPGLGFSDGEITYNGFPLSQASGREKIEISCAICLAQHPKIGVLTIDEGWSELDSEGKQVITDFAKQNDAQIWTTQVSDEPGGEGFHIVDGELIAIDGIPICEDIPYPMSPMTGTEPTMTGTEAAIGAGAGV
ncbi:MAG: AAA family ATPase [bacterium]